MKDRVLTPSTEEPTIEIPLRIVQTIIATGNIDELEDWLLAHGPDFIARMQRARDNDLAGRSIPWEKVKEELGIK
ncbi:MAG: hypothetical protein ACUVV0_07150 [Anaerolineae bacterium]